ncbi:MAG: hypothetical protein V4565_05320 [Bacteroidota bacterium]
MTTKSDAGLQEYIDNRNKFSSVAVHAAIDELKKRGRTFTDEEFTQIVNDLEKQQEISRQRVADSDGGQKWDKNIVDDINAVELYSQKAINGFSIAFGVLFGSILMAMNMKRASSQKSVTLTIVFGIAYTAVQLYALSFIPRNTGLTLMTSFGGALILNYVFWKKFIGVDTPYRKRKIWTPLIIGVIIFALFMTVMIIAPTE